MSNEITAEMIKERANEIQRRYKRTWTEKNRDHINSYMREWRRKYRETHGVAYSTVCNYRKAERELMKERETDEGNRKKVY